MASSTEEAADGSRQSEDLASKSAVRRLQRDLVALSKSPNPQITVQPASANILEWHFVLHDLPDDTPYNGGCYHGKILFPPAYPNEPPSLLMITPSGRLEVNQRLCLSMTDFHPETWHPLWTVESILVGLLSFFISDRESGVGCVSATPEERVRLAQASWATNAGNADFRELFPDFAQRAGSSEASPGATTTPGDATAASPTAASPGPAPSTPSAAASPSASSGAGAAADDAPAAEQRAAGAAAALAPAAGAEAEATSDAPECIICTQGEELEPLIYPCACRMGGVHASCVERWVAQHRRSATRPGPPRCSVCGQPYMGSDQRPGMSDFLRHMCYKALRQFLRYLVFVTLLILYQIAAQSLVGPRRDEFRMPPWASIPIVVFCLICGARKAAVLCVSLPAHQPPPAQRYRRRFFVSSPRILSQHIGEMLAAASVLGFWACLGVIPWVFVLPSVLLSLLPVAKVLASTGGLLRAVRAGLCLILTLPLVLIHAVVHLLRVLWRSPGSMFHPLGPALHIGVPLASVPLCFLESNVPLVCLWGAHIVLMSAGLLDLLCGRRLSWRPSVFWLVALQLTFLSAYGATLVFQFPRGVGYPHSTDIVVDIEALAWFSVFVVFAAAVNRDLLMGLFRQWQQRHGRFTLDRPAREEAGARLAGDGQRPAEELV